MERNALNKLILWNEDKNRKPLIVWGARQVGKTYLIRDIFANKFYKDNYIYIDLNVEDEIVKDLDGTANADKIIQIISLRKHKRIDSNTLLIFDEIQECPNIITSLKYFCQDHRDIPVIATGSMVRIKLLREARKRGNKKFDFLYPVGKINQITLYPLTFDEYLLNVNEIMYKYVKDAYNNKQVIDDSIHSLVMEEFNKYLLVGGMPEAVDTYIKSNDLLKTIDTLKEIYDDYLADMSLYQASNESIIRSRNVFSNIYKELNKESKNFSSGLIEKDTKTRDYKSPIEWLTLARLVNQSKQLKQIVTIPFIEENESYFRLYLSDMGIFTYQSGINASTFISKDCDNKLAGIFYENYVACELKAHDLDLYYWKGKDRYELEFMVLSNGEIYPIDVKKGRSSLGSLDNYRQHNSYKMAIKVSNNNYGYNKEKKLLTIPFYYFPFVCEELKNGKFNQDNKIGNF